LTLYRFRKKAKKSENPFFDGIIFIPGKRISPEKKMFFLLCLRSDDQTEWAVIVILRLADFAISDEAARTEAADSLKTYSLSASQ
jgi:hypothetical protein